MCYFIIKSIFLSNFLSISSISFIPQNCLLLVSFLVAIFNGFLHWRKYMVVDRKHTERKGVRGHKLWPTLQRRRIDAMTPHQQCTLLFLLSQPSLSPLVCPQTHCFTACACHWSVSVNYPVDIYSICLLHPGLLMGRDPMWA